MQPSMRRKDREMSTEETEQLLIAGEYGVLSTVDADGQPHSTPLNYVYADGCIFFHCALAGHKLENIKNNNKVAFCVVGRTEILPEKFSTNYESAVITGIAIESTGVEKEQALLYLVNKYSPDFIKEGMEYISLAAAKTRVLKIKIVLLTGKARK